MRRLPIVLIPLLLALALVAGTYLWRLNDEGVGRVVTTGTAKVGGPFALTDQDGHPRASSEFRGRFMLIYFGYTFCPDVCPTTLQLMSDALAKLPSGARQRIVPIFITVDPARDTPAQLKSYLHAFGPGIVGLTGDAKTLAKVEAEFVVYAKKKPLPGGTYAMDHSSAIYLMDPNGRFVTYWDDTAIGPAKLAEELRARL